MSLSAYRAEILHFLHEPKSEEDSESYQYFQDGILLIENGKIKGVGDAKTLSPTLAEGCVINRFENSLIVPGFIDTHTHYPQTRNIASYGNQLLEWLEKTIFPSEKLFSDEEFAMGEADFFLSELLRNGTTTALVFATVHKQSVTALFKQAIKRNMRIISGKTLMDCHAPKEILDTPESAYQESKQLIEEWHGKNRLSYAITPRFALTSTEEQLEAAGKLLEEFPGVYMHTHLCENRQEIKRVKELFPWSKNYLDVYERFNLLGDHSVFAHGVHLSDDEFRTLKKSNSAIAFCPSSNLFLGSGLFNFAKAKEFEIKLGLGTDVGAGTSM